MDTAADTKPPIDQAKLSVSAALLQDAQPDPTAIAIRRGVAEFSGTLGAGVLGTMAFSALPSRISAPLRLAAAAASGGVVKFGVKGAFEHALLDQKYHTTSAKDLMWGAVDGLAGVGAAKFEQYASGRLTTELGYRMAGKAISSETALEVGRKALAGSVSRRIEHNAVRGLGAGFVGSLIYSTPHAVHDNFAGLGTEEGLKKTVADIGINTAIGTVFGGLLSAGISTAANAREIYRYSKAAMSADDAITRVDALHFNDMHSALMGERASLPQLATKADELRAAARAKGRTALLFDLGDNYSGNVIAGSTDVGYVETAAIQKMKVDGFIPGNHVADIGFGKTDVDSWVRNMNRVRNEVGHELPALAANIDVPTYPGFIGPNGMYRPYRVVTAANGEKIGLIGLVTRELDTGSDGAVRFMDAKNAAEKTIGELNQQGINKIIVLSHMGRGDDVALAHSLKGKVAAIIGAHSHDIEPVPLWVKNSANGTQIPIVQAGSKAGWLGELNLAIKADGSTDKYRTFGRIHEIHSGIAPKTEIQDFIRQEITRISDSIPGTYKVTDLNNQVYSNVQIEKAFPLDGIRGEAGAQTPLGSLVSKALLEETNARLPQINAQRAAQGLEPLERMTIMLKHTGDIREELAAGTLNRLKASNVFLNTGSASRETKELASVQLTGQQLRRALEFSVHDLPAAEAAAQSSRLSQALQRLKALFVEQRHIDSHDYTGNFLMGEGIRYSYNRALPPGQRVTSVEVRDSLSQTFLPVDEGSVYNVLTLFHPIDKWGKGGLQTIENFHAAYNTPQNWVFGTRLGSNEARALVNAQGIELSQVDLLISYLSRQNRPVNPLNFSSGAIEDLTPRPWTAPVVVGRYSVPSMAVAAGAQPILKKESGAQK